MDRERQTTILFADISGSTKLYEAVGDKLAMDAIASCLDRLGRAAQAAGGRIVKTIGDEIMSAFRSPDAASAAATRMQYAIEGLPAVGDIKLGVRIGFHCGPVIQNESDVFGDTVNLAARLVEQAASGQILTSQETVDRLGQAFRDSARQLYTIHVKGKTEEVALCELIWRKVGDVTVSTGLRTISVRMPVVLRLRHGDREIVRRRERDSITIGRDPDCGIIVATSMASRRHCIIERRQDKFILADQSTNGTYVSPDGDTEKLLQREEFPLGKHGWITLGEPRAAAAETVEYFCE